MMNFLGVFNFSAIYLPWVLTLFSFAISGSIPYSDILGISFGHIVWFCEDIVPSYYSNSEFIRFLYFGHFKGTPVIVPE